MKLTTNLHCVESQKNTDLIYTVVEAWNHVQKSSGRGWELWSTCKCPSYFEWVEELCLLAADARVQLQSYGFCGVWEACLQPGIQVTAVRAQVDGGSEYACNLLLIFLKPWVCLLMSVHYLCGQSLMIMEVLHICLHILILCSVKYQMILHLW
jgi:hypothetical protein